ncbi:hypothetical protein C6N01_13140 [Enterococcus faecalis]|uniref:hypothetical protein n=1 Tax=Enterococcus faecalis TaxID=1351 RepID=UPI001363B3E3|nr:hypothetical protein [Enterococcus faecalis]NBJ47152.1 hypothetical protein [Enterococcus faecalis]
MKKKQVIIATMMVGAIGVSFSTSAYATQTIDGSTTGEIKTTGELGREDNTNPGSEIPDGDDKWINVTLPTEVIFYNVDGEEDIKSSANYEILNNSGRPVKVDLTSFRIANTITTEREAIKTLNLANASGKSFNPVNLVENGVEKVTTTQELVRLANNEGKIGSVNDPSAKLTRFRFDGSVNKDKLSEEQPTTIDSTLNLKFTALNMAGQEVAE